MTIELSIIGSMAHSRCPQDVQDITGAFIAGCKGTGQYTCSKMHSFPYWENDNLQIKNCNYQDVQIFFKLVISRLQYLNFPIIPL